MNLILHFYRFTPFVRDHFLRSGLLAPKMTSPHFTYLVALRQWHESGAAELAHFTINSQLDYTSKITKAKRVSAALVWLKLIHFLLDNKSSNVQLCFVKEVNRREMWISQFFVSSEIFVIKIENISTKVKKDLFLSKNSFLTEPHFSKSLIFVQNLTLRHTYVQVHISNFAPVF